MIGVIWLWCINICIFILGFASGRLSGEIKRSKTVELPTKPKEIPMPNVKLPKVSKYGGS